VPNLVGVGRFISASLRAPKHRCIESRATPTKATARSDSGCAVGVSYVTPGGLLVGLQLRDLLGVEGALGPQDGWRRRARGAGQASRDYICKVGRDNLQIAL